MRFHNLHPSRYTSAHLVDEMHEMIVGTHFQQIL